VPSHILSPIYSYSVESRGWDGTEDVYKKVLAWAANMPGGPIYEVEDPNDSVIEGYFYGNYQSW